MPSPNIPKKRRILWLLVLILFLNLFSPSGAKAAFWPGIDPPITRMLDTLYETIQGVIIGTLKQQAATMLNNQMNRLIGGGSGGQAMFITNWQDYLVAQPMNQTVNYMNDYISQVTMGRGSMTGYSAEGFVGNYMQSLTNDAMNVLNQSIPKITYEGDPSQMFAAGNFRNMNQYLSGVNNPWAFNQLVTSEYQKKLEEQRRQAEIKALSGQGFIGQEDEFGNTVYPGYLVGQNVASVQDLGNKIIADAQHIPEVITAIVSQMITRSIQQGFTQVQMRVNTQMNQANQKMMNSMKSTGPGGRF